MDQCPTCRRWWVQCPCCDVRFCPDCMLEEDDAEEDDEPESDEERKERTEFVRKKFAEYIEKKG